MEAAAKQVKLLTQRILPDRPHHLSYDPDSRYPVDPDAQAPEEFIHRRLQYMTFLSDGDRGVLLTRPYYDMREEPPTPSAREVAAPSRSDRRPATKLSLSDYKNKVKQKSQSPLPLAGTPAKQLEDVASKSTQERRDDSQQLEPRKKDASQPIKESRVPGSKDPLFRDPPSSLPPKPPPARPPTPSPAKKRGSDEDGTPRPAKRNKTDANGTSDEKFRGQKDSVPRDKPDAPRKKDTPTMANSIPDKGDGKAGTGASSATNGRSMLKAAMSSAQNGSPNARLRAGSLNGSRTEPGGSSKSTPIKTQTPSSGTKPTVPPLLSPLHSSSGTKASVPPLLSPLHISFGGSDAPKKSAKAPKKEEKSDRDRPTPKGKSEKPPPAPAKKVKSPLTIPPLLSPTLPPIIEEELLRRKKATSKASGSRSPEHLKNAKKPQVASKDVEKPKRERHIVTLKYPKRLAKRVERLLALPGKNERLAAAEKQQPPQTSKKRPLQSGGPPEMSGDALGILTAAMKRPRKTEASKTAPVPSTPSRPPSAVGHVNTPGDSGLGSSQPTQATSDYLKQRGERYIALGTKLKHRRDHIAKQFPANQLPDPEHKLTVVTGIEATLSYMVGFRSLFEFRRGERKQPDPGVWRTLVPFVTELHRQAKKLPFAHALLLILHELILQELLTCLYLGDLRAQGAVADLQQAGTSQFNLRRQILGVYRQAEESGPKLPELNAGVPFDEGICRALEAVGAWAEDEGLEWKASLSADEVLGGT